MGKDALSADDLANLLGVTTRTLRNWERDGSGPRREIRELEPFYPFESLVPWLKKNRPGIKLGEAAKVTDRAGRLVLLERWEKTLCSRYGLKSTDELYEAIRHADFHATRRPPDKIEFWHLAAYATFSGVIVRHRLTPEKLRELLADFQNRRDFGLAAKKQMTAREFAEQIQQALTEVAFEEMFKNVSSTRQERDHVAISHRYCCAVVGEYYAPPGNPNIMADLEQLSKSESESQTSAM